MRIRRPKLLPTVAALVVLSAISVPAYCLQCRFKLATYTYDLCPLLLTDYSLSSMTSSSRHIRIQKDASTPLTLTRNIYDIDLGGRGLKKDPTLPEIEQCPDGTWICLQISNTRPAHLSEPGRIVQVTPISGNIREYSMVDEIPRPYGVNATARLVAPTRTNEQTIPVVEVTLNGGWHHSRPQRAVISFLCDESITEPSVPIPMLFEHDFSSPTTALPLDEMSDSRQIDSHGFTWVTKHACPIAQNVNFVDATQTAEAPSESSHVGKGNQGGEGNVSPEVPLSDGDGTHPVNLMKTAGIIIGSLLALAVCYEILVTLIHRRKQRYIPLSRGDTPHARPLSLGIIIPPLPSPPFSIPSFLNPFRRSLHRTRFGSRLGNIYDPLIAEEYEIRDEGDGAVVDFQRQGLLQGRKTDPASDNGYGSVR